MSTLAHPSELSGPREGGVAARRAVVRWAGRMFRREWRQQILVTALLSVAVAAAIGSITIVSNTGAEQANEAEFGSATFIVEFDGANARELEAGLASAKEWFGTIDVIGHRSVKVPGSVTRLDVRAQSPDGAYGGGLLALRRGRYPEGPGQVAVTDGVAKLLRLEIGSTLALEGLRRKVVGIVENPRKLSDEFALVSPSSAGQDYVTVLVDSDIGSFSSFGESVGDRGALVSMRARGNDLPVGDELAMFSVVTVFLLLASLVAAAGFAVVAQRRLRQLGMLAAVGATRKHLRLVLLTNGVAVGAIAVLIGTIAGLALWLVFAPTLESAIDHRVDRLDLPWGLLVATVLVAVLGATAAAWWPGRTVSRLPVTLALSGRPPRPRPARYSAIAAAALIAVGMGSLALSNRERAPFIVAGILATVLGCLLLGPLAIRIFSRVARRVSIAPRLALRDLARYQARSGAALGAITLALGIAAAVVIVASAEEGKSAGEPPNLSDRQIRVYLGPGEARELSPILASAEVERLAGRVRQLAAQLDGAAVLTLHHALRPGTQSQVVDGTRAHFPIALMRAVDTGGGRKMYSPESQVYVATPAVLRHLGIDPDTVDPSANFLADPAVRTGKLVILSLPSAEELRVSNVQRVDLSGHLFGSAGQETNGKPPTFITLEGLRRHGWKQVPAGWLVESAQPLTSDQIADARELAANAGLTVEVRREGTSLATAKAAATAAGALLALAILAMTVGLIRSESAGDLRTLTATGATSRIRRTLTGATAGALALLGALLGVAGAYVLLAALYYDDLGHLSNVPVFYLALAILGLPVAAATAGWLLAGREPPAIARAVIE
jgi:putative ABC transport system permease protein